MRTGVNDWESIGIETILKSMRQHKITWGDGRGTGGTLGYMRNQER
jgi:hypothetical protein